MSSLERFRHLFAKCLFIGLSLALFGLSMSLGTWVYIKFTVLGKVVIVPELSGLDIQEAKATLDNLGLLLRIDAEQKIHHQDIAQDRVFLQTPGLGRKVKTGTVVDVILSAGPELRKAPLMEGETLSFSSTLLQRVGVGISVLSRVPSALAGKGRVLSQAPHYGEAFGLRQGASLLVSDGAIPELYVMPDLEGRDFDAVKSTLEAHSFRVVAKYVFQNPEVGQVVLQQIPRPGYPVKSSDTITITVNKDF